MDRDFNIKGWDYPSGSRVAFIENEFEVLLTLRDGGSQLLLRIGDKCVWTPSVLLKYLDTSWKQ